MRALLALLEAEPPGGLAVYWRVYETKVSVRFTPQHNERWRLFQLVLMRDDLSLWDWRRVVSPDGVPRESPDIVKQNRRAPDLMARACWDDPVSFGWLMTLVGGLRVEGDGGCI